MINTDIPENEQMLCMSLCKNNIIANSTFSWWGAFLNNNKIKNIIYPSTWFGPGISIPPESLLDLFPSNWLKI
jgi:hypothetical protein